MNWSRSVFSKVLGFSAVADVLHAHPGHDGHELTWDASHASSNLLPFLILVVAVALAIWRYRPER
jgi:hypothetical protein